MEGEKKNLGRVVGHVGRVGGRHIAGTWGGHQVVGRNWVIKRNDWAGLLSVGLRNWMMGIGERV